MKQKKYIIFSIILSFISALGIIKGFVYAAASSNINATIQISVCGNLVAEGGEDCDNTDLKGKSCTSLGYSSGTLGCDISCSYNTTACVVSTPTPTPSPTVTSTQGPTSTPPPSVTTSQNTPTPQIVIATPTPEFIATVQNSFPSALKVFIGENGTITVQELHQVLTLWVAGWKDFIKPGDSAKTKNAIAQNACDVNHDGLCSIADLSVLLFHVTQ